MISISEDVNNIRSDVSSLTTFKAEEEELLRSNAPDNEDNEFSSFSSFLYFFDLCDIELLLDGSDTTSKPSFVDDSFVGLDGGSSLISTTGLIGEGEEKPDEGGEGAALVLRDRE